MFGSSYKVTFYRILVKHCSSTKYEQLKHAKNKWNELPVVNEISAYSNQCFFSQSFTIGVGETTTEARGYYVVSVFEAN